jgi:hypothetical protein
MQSAVNHIAALFFICERKHKRSVLLTKTQNIQKRSGNEVES